MVTKEFADASAELMKIMEYLPKEEVEKIPNKLLEFFKNIESKNYKLQIDPNKPLEEQDIKEKTKDLIAVLYRNYWCDDEERNILDRRLLENNKKYEKELREKYSVDNIFKSRKKPMNENKKVNMIVVRKKWYNKLIDKIKSIFK